MTELEKITKMIAKQTAKYILPRVKKIVREEIESSFNELIREMKKSKRGKQIAEVVTEEVQTIDQAKEKIAARVAQASAKAQSHLTNIYKGDFDVDDLIESAVDPQQDKTLQHLEQMSKPLIDVTVMTENDVDPAMIDYSAMMKKLG